MASVVIDKTDLLSVKNSLSVLNKESSDAIRFATNDALAGIKTESSRLIGERITANISAIKKTITVKKMFISDMTANVTCKGEPLPLAVFKVSQVKQGVKAQVFKPGTPTLVKHAFIATMKSGHKGVFWRKDRPGGTGKWPVGKRMLLPSPKIGTKLRQYQLKIVERFGPRVPDVFGDNKVMDPVLANASNRFDDRLKYHTDRLIEKARAA